MCKRRACIGPDEFEVGRFLKPSAKWENLAMLLPATCLYASVLDRLRGSFKTTMFPAMFLLALLLQVSAGATVADESDKTPLTEEDTEATVSAKPLLADRESVEKLIEKAVRPAGVKDRRVLRSIRQVPRHRFVPEKFRKYSYHDTALPIGHGQTISPPSVVAYMTEQLDPKPDDKVLEIGTGSGYQAAVLSNLVGEVYSIEIVEPLGQRAAKVLEALEYDNVHVRVGDGYRGWPEKAPFDGILVTCSPEDVPQPLIDQLAEGGKLIIPVGERYQQIFYLFEKKDGKLEKKPLAPALFVPMTGRAEEEREVQPDATHPQIVGGDFEEVVGREKRPAGWHVARQVEVVEENAPSGDRFVRFRSEKQNELSQLLQGMAIDGSEVEQLEVSFHARGYRIQPPEPYDRVPVLTLTFYNEERFPLEEVALGPCSGTFPWSPLRQTVEVPEEAAEVICQLGLHGASGQLDLDALTLHRLVVR